jgi:hypothetical protein
MIVDNRHHLADIGRRLPTLTGFGMTLRWLAWSAYSGPVAAAGWLLLYIHILGIAAATFAGWVPFGLLWSAVGGWWGLVASGGAEDAAWGAGIVAATFAGGAWFFTRDEITIPGIGSTPEIKLPGPRKVKRLLFSRVGRWGLWLSSFVLMAFTVGGWYLLALGVLAVVMRLVDTVLAEASDWYDGRALYGQFRKEFPIQWAIIASKSKKVQSITDTSGESNVADLAVSRPILEHPASWPLPRQPSPYTFEWPIWRSPGRGLVELADVRDELAAQFSFVQDRDDAIELIWPDRDGSNFRSWAWMRVHFHDRAHRRDPFGGGTGGGGVGRAARWLRDRRTPPVFDSPYPHADAA